MLIKALILAVTALQTGTPEPINDVRGRQIAECQSRAPSGVTVHCEVATGARGKPAHVQMSMPLLQSYCKDMTHASSEALLARSRKLPRSEFDQRLQGVTEPYGYNMAKALLDFAWSQPEGTSYQALQSTLNELCLARKIFAR